MQFLPPFTLHIVTMPSDGTYQTIPAALEAAAPFLALGIECAITSAPNTGPKGWFWSLDYCEISPETTLASLRADATAEAERRPTAEERSTYAREMGSIDYAG